ncbi:MAG: hypothetical protein AAF533_17095 [Acidobacteriota bacterium]
MSVTSRARTPGRLSGALGVVILAWSMSAGATEPGPAWSPGWTPGTYWLVEHRRWFPGLSPPSRLVDVSMRFLVREPDEWERAADELVIIEVTSSRVPAGAGHQARRTGYQWHVDPLTGRVHRVRRLGARVTLIPGQEERDLSSARQQDWLDMESLFGGWDHGIAHRPGPIELPLVRWPPLAPGPMAGTLRLDDPLGCVVPGREGEVARAWVHRVDDGVTQVFREGQPWYDVVQRGGVDGKEHHLSRVVKVGQLSPGELIRERMKVPCDPRLDDLERASKLPWRRPWEPGETWTESFAHRRGLPVGSGERATWHAPVLSSCELRYLVREPDPWERELAWPDARVLEVRAELRDVASGETSAPDGWQGGPLLITFEPSTGDVVRIRRFRPGRVPGTVTLETIEKTASGETDPRSMAAELLGRGTGHPDPRWPAIRGVDANGHWWLGPVPHRLGADAWRFISEPEIVHVDYRYESEPWNERPGSLRHVHPPDSPWPHVVSPYDPTRSLWEVAEPPDRRCDLAVTAVREARRLDAHELERARFRVRPFTRGEGVRHPGRVHRATLAPGLCSGASRQQARTLGLDPSARPDPFVPPW